MRALAIVLLLALCALPARAEEPTKIPDQIKELDSMRAHLLAEQQGRLEAEIRWRQNVLADIIEQRKNFLAKLRQTYRMGAEDTWDGETYVIQRKKAGAK
jgi:hypothetical protein